MSREVVFIVDDVEINRDILSEVLEEEYSIAEAANGLEALNYIKQHEDDIAVVLLDLMMPVMDGNEVLQKMREAGLLQKIPVLIISGETDVATEESCLALGASDFIHKPFAPNIVKHRVMNTVALAEYRNKLEEKVKEQTKELRERNDRLRRVNRNTIELLGSVVEARNMESGMHVRRVKGFTMILAQRVMEKYPDYGITPEMVNAFAQASIMHDVGKIMVSDTILLKPGKLTPEEFAEMKKHTIYGCEILEKSKDLWDNEYHALCKAVCRSHHEKWDGRGYPDGLAGDEIPLVAQIVSIADCYDALTTERPYKKPWPPQKAYEMVMNGECGEFNPRLLDCLKDCKADFEDFCAQTDGK